jgi:hypothetical protein
MTSVDVDVQFTVSAGSKPSVEDILDQRVESAGSPPVDVHELWSGAENFEIVFGRST